MKSIILHDFEVRNALKNDVIQIRRPIPQADGVTKDGVVYKFKTIDVVRNWGIETISHPDGKPTHRYCDIIKCPFGQAGDRLWAKETWGYQYNDSNSCPRYKATSNEDVKWKSSVRMPRWASRITLEVDEIWVERLQDITDEDAKAEGIRSWDGPDTYTHDGIHIAFCARTAFCNLWNSIYAKQGAGWDANPWVRAVKFRVAERK